MKAKPIRLATPELRGAYTRGKRAKGRGTEIQANPYRPCSDGDLWRAWNTGFANGGESKYVRHRKNLVRAVVEKHGEICWLCHRELPVTALTLDHVIPKSKGGGASRENLRPAHAKCNRKRGNGPPPELLLRKDMMLDAQAGEADRPRRNTDSGSVHEHAVSEADAPVLCVSA